MKHWLRHPALTLALSASLVFASGPAAALGLGQIEVRSRAGQPLLAEIPIISNDPAELEALQARLASPETFARVGLQAPQGVVADLQFSVGADARGRPVIRVTSDAPIEQPLLTFLVEVEWGQGRLVREYSALVDAPRTVAAPVQTPIQAPTTAPSNVVARPAAAAPQQPTGQARAAVSPDGGSTGASSGEYGPVRRGETLSLIADRLGLTDGHSLDQAMIALLRANPDAFIGGDINRLRSGAVLRVPQAAELAAVDAVQASEIVRNRLRQWREARRAAPPSTTVAAAPVEPAARATGTAAPASRSSSATTGSARLEIVPPAPGRARRAGNQTGIQAGGEGQMLSQELQQTKETLAARDAELQELKGRIAELERLQADQQKLLELKDSELASVQKRVATAQQPAAPAPEPSQPREAAWWPWLLGGAALLAAVLGWWWGRRRAAAQPAFRAPPASSASSLAAAFPSRESPAVDSTPARIEPQPAEATTSTAADPARSVPVAAEPDLHAAPVVTSASPVHEPASTSEPVIAEDANVAAPAGASRNERIELARAYIELGDHDSARQLLGEVAVTGDLASRQQATRMLREID